MQVFTHFNSQHITYAYGDILKLVEFRLALPGTNAATKRAFSLTSFERTQISVDTLPSLLVTKTNFRTACIQFCNMPLAEIKLLKAVHTLQKYRPSAAAAAK